MTTPAEVRELAALQEQERAAWGRYTRTAQIIMWLFFTLAVLNLWIFVTTDESGMLALATAVALSLIAAPTMTLLRRRAWSLTRQVHDLRDQALLTDDD